MTPIRKRMSSARAQLIGGLLTVIATVFMPLTFITGYYGMNFNTESPWNMPLLNYRYGGLVAVGMMLLTTAGLPELIVQTAEDYEALALALARDPARLKNLRDKLAANRATAPATKRIAPITSHERRCVAM